MVCEAGTHHHPKIVWDNAGCCRESPSLILAGIALGNKGTCACVAISILCDTGQQATKRYSQCYTPCPAGIHHADGVYVVLQMANLRLRAAWQKRKPCSCDACSSSGPASYSGTAPRGPSSSAEITAPTVLPTVLVGNTSADFASAAKAAMLMSQEFGGMCGDPERSHSATKEAPHSAKRERQQQREPKQQEGPSASTINAGSNPTAAVPGAARGIHRSNPDHPLEQGEPERRPADAATGIEQVPTTAAAGAAETIEPFSLQMEALCERARMLGMQNMDSCSAAGLAGIVAAAVQLAKARSPQRKATAVAASTQDTAALAATAAAADAMAAKLIAEEEEAAAKKRAKQGAAVAAAKQKRQGEDKKQQQEAGKEQVKGGKLQHSSKLDSKATAAASEKGAGATEADWDHGGSGAGKLGACGSQGQQLQQLTGEEHSKDKGCQDKDVRLSRPAPPPPAISRAKAEASSIGSSSSSSGTGDNGAVVAPAAAAAANPASAEVGGRVGAAVQSSQEARYEKYRQGALAAAAAAADSMAAKLIAEEEEAAAKKQAKQEAAAAAAKAAKQKRQGEHKQHQQQAGKLKEGKPQHSTKLDLKGSAAASLPPLAAGRGVGVGPGSAAAEQHLIAAGSSSAVAKGAAGPEGQRGSFQPSRAAGALSSAEDFGTLSNRIAGAAGKVCLGDAHEPAAESMAQATGGGNCVVSRRSPAGVRQGGVAGAADVRGAGGAAARTAVRGVGVLTAELPATAGGSLGDGRATVGIATVECGGAFGNHSGGGGSGLRAAAAAGADGCRPVLQQQQLPSGKCRQPQNDGLDWEQQLQQVGMKKSPGKPSKRPSPCVVCWESPPCVVLLPCKHLVLCEACSKMMEGKGTECPMCRATVEQHMIYSASAAERFEEVRGHGVVRHMLVDRVRLRGISDVFGQHSGCHPMTVYIT